MDFSAMRISTEDFTPEKVKQTLADARAKIAQEDPSINGTAIELSFQREDHFIFHRLDKNFFRLFFL